MRSDSPLNFLHAVSDRSATAVNCDYVPLSHLADYLADPAKKIMAIISFGEAAHVIPPQLCLHINVDAPQLGDTRLVEVWTSSGLVSCNEHQGIYYAVSEDMLFGSIHLPASGQAAIGAVVRSAYRRIFDLLQAEAHPHLIRVWNYVPDINKTIDGMGQYQSFCLGRYQAIFERNNFFERDLPAASTIGTHNSGLQIYFLAARQTGQQIENPRQVSAFRYPRCYGPRSPSFSRAILKEWGDEHHLYISGTASIVGHESCHSNNPLEQLGETLQNIKSLLEHAKRTSNTGCGSLSNLSSIKIYIRHAQHFAETRLALEQHIGQEIPALYLQGDICRNDLLLEIEAIYHAGGN